jgi:hypothetical protein
MKQTNKAYIVKLIPPTIIASAVHSIIHGRKPHAWALLSNGQVVRVFSRTQ